MELKTRFLVNIIASPTCSGAKTKSTLPSNRDNSAMPGVLTVHRPTGCRLLTFQPDAHLFDGARGGLLGKARQRGCTPSLDLLYIPLTPPPLGMGMPYKMARLNPVVFGTCVGTKCDDFTSVVDSALSQCQPIPFCFPVPLTWKAWGKPSLTTATTLFSEFRAGSQESKACFMELKTRFLVNIIPSSTQQGKHHTHSPL